MLLVGKCDKIKMILYDFVSFKFWEVENDWCDIFCQALPYKGKNLFKNWKFKTTKPVVIWVKKPLSYHMTRPV